MHANTICKETKALAVIVVAILMVVAAAAVVLSSESVADTTEKYTVEVSQKNESGYSYSTHTVSAGKTLRIDTNNELKLYVGAISMVKAIPEDTDRYHYEFAGWQYKVTGADDSTLAPVTADGIAIYQNLTVIGDLIVTTNTYNVYAVVDEETPYGTLQWYDETGAVDNPINVNYWSEVYSTGNVLYVNDIETGAKYHAEAIPMEVNINSTDYYFVFDSWDLAVSQITGELTVTATFKEVSLIVWDEERGIEYRINDLETYEVTAIGYKTGVESITVVDSFKVDGVTYTPVAIAGNAFVDCDTTDYISIGANVVNIADGALSNRYIRSILVSEDNEAYASVSGVLYDKGITTLIKFPASKQRLVIPATVEVIADYAFQDAGAQLKSEYSGSGDILYFRYVNIPASVIEIGAYAFENSTVETLKLANGTTTIGAGAFAGCQSLKYVLFNDTLEEVGDGAFSDCVFFGADGNEMEFSIENMSGHKFTGDSSEALNVYIPKAGGTIVSNGLKFKITSADDMTVALQGTVDDGMTSIYFPAAISYLGFKWSVNAIASKAFYDDSTITGVGYLDDATAVSVEPAAITIGSKAFANCTSLEFVDINIGKVNSYAFRGCTALTEIPLDNATYIGSRAFSGCSSLVDVDLSAVVDVGSCAFFGCSLDEADLSSATSIGYKAFAGNNLTYVKFSASLSNIDALAFAGYTFKDLMEDKIDVTASNLAANSYGGAGKVLTELAL